MRILHTMLRVGDMQRSVNFYTEVLGMKLLRRMCDAVRAKGGKVTREPGPVKGGTTVIAFVEDPDGYKVEFIQRK